MARKRFGATLPKVSCTVELRDRLIAFCDERGLSLGDVQRNALYLYLESRKRKASSDNQSQSNQVQSKEGK